jgi:hypothetical protein
MDHYQHFIPPRNPAILICPCAATHIPLCAQVIDIKSKLLVFGKKAAPVFQQRAMQNRNTRLEVSNQWCVENEELRVLRAPSPQFSILDIAMRYHCDL